MSETWANASDEAAARGATLATVGGLDLHLDLSGHRVRLGLETALRDAIRAGLRRRNPAAVVAGAGR